MGFDSDLRSLIQNLPRTGGGSAGVGPAGVPVAGGSSPLADSAEEMTFATAEKADQRLQRRKLQLQTRGLSGAGASQVIAGEPVSNPVDELMVSRALGRPPSPGV
jgi:hypothetical protein